QGRPDRLVDAQRHERSRPPTEGKPRPLAAQIRARAASVCLSPRAADSPRTAERRAHKMIEVWKPVVDRRGVSREGEYEVSNLGRVRSLDRNIEQTSCKGTPCVRFVRGRMLRPGRQSG